MTVDEAVRFFYRVYWEQDQHRQFDTLTQAVLDRPGATVIELGAGHEGLSSVLFLSAGGEVWSVDMVDFGNRWDGYPYHFLEADDVSEEAQKWLPEECEVLFIDSAHTYDHTLKELRTYGPRVKSGGVIMLHDTEYSGGTQGHILPEPTGPVAVAISDWCGENHLAWTNLPGSYGLGIVLI